MSLLPNNLYLYKTLKIDNKRCVRTCVCLPVEWRVDLSGAVVLSTANRNGDQNTGASGHLYWTATP